MACLAFLALAGCSADEPSKSSGSGSPAGSGGSAPASSGIGGTSEFAASSGAGASGGSGAGSGGGAVDCKSLPLCDDFEGSAVGGPPDAALWTVAMPSCSGTGTLAVASEAHSGTKSVKVDGKGGYCNHVFIANASVIGGLGDVAYARFWLRVSAPLGAGHTTFLAMKDDADGGKDLRMGGQNMVLMFNRESDDATLPAMSPAGTAMSLSLEANTWTCVELMVDGAQGLLTTWIDGAEVPGLKIDAQPTPDVDQQWLTKSWKPNVSDFRLGWESYAGQDLTLWFDDVALATQRVGCN